MTPARLQALSFALAAATTLTARATEPDAFGALPRGMATAGAQTATSDDAGAAFYNVANLALAGASGHPSVELGYAMSIPELHIQGLKPDAANPPQQPPSEGWITAGALIPLGGKIGHLASLGLLAEFPVDEAIRLASYTPQDPQWIRYQADPDRLSLAGGLGVRVHKFVAVGIGFQMLAGLAGTVALNANLVNGQVLQRDATINLSPAFTPTAGLTIQPDERLRFSLAYRAPLSMPVDLPVQIGLNALGTLNLTVKGVVDYSPHEVTFGAMGRPVTGLTLSLNVDYEHWTGSPIPALALSASGGGEIAMLLSPTSGPLFQTNDAAPNFVDTVTPRVAAEYELPGGRWIIRAGYAYQPTYVPPQTGATNYLDAPTHILGTGATFMFRDPIDLLPLPVKIVVAAQAHLIPTEHVVKTDTGDPVGNYSFGGAVYAVSASLRLDM